MSGPVRARGARNSGFHMSVQREQESREENKRVDMIVCHSGELQKAQHMACGDSRAHWRSLQNGYSHPRDLGAR